MYHKVGTLADRLEQLRSLTKSIDCAPGPGGSRCTDFKVTQDIYEPVLKDVFDGRWTRAMLVVLYPSSQLVAHKDPPIEGTRYHIPLFVNDGCWTFHDGIWRQLEAGHVYIMDPTEVHGAVNWGHDIRIHLSIDCQWQNQNSPQ